MNKEIKYNGFTAVPSDYECQDGDLAVSLNLMQEDGCLKPLSKPETVIVLPSEVLGVAGPFEWVGIHTPPGSGRKHYIFKKVVVSGISDTMLYWNGDSFGYISTFDYGISKIVPQGNVLVVVPFLKSHPMEYLKWTDGEYLRLGTRPPLVDMSFGLEFSPAMTYDGASVTIENVSEALLNEIDDTSSGGRRLLHSMKIPSSEIMALTQCYHSVVNKAIADATAEGKFCFPFLIRYAFRLYDGTYAWHSAPVLMIPSTDTPNVHGSFERNDNNLKVSMTVNTTPNGATNGMGMLNVCRLTSRILPFNTAALLAWEDVLFGLDIFVSPQIYQYSVDDNVAIDTLYDRNDSNRAHFGNYTYASRDYKDYTLSRPKKVFKVEKGDIDLSSKIKEAANFYKIASIDFVDILPGTKMKPLELDSKNLSNLLTRSTLADDFHSRDNLNPSVLLSMNSRLDISSITNTPAHPYPYRVSLPFSEDSSYFMGMVRTTVLLKKNGGIVKISYDDWCEAAESNGPLVAVPRFLFYPDVDAYMLIVSLGGSHWHFPLKPHEFLNGAFWVDEILVPGQCAVSPKSYADIPSEAVLSYDMLGKIYVTEVNNPFVFRPETAVTLAVNKVFGIATAAKALSQGQFGQFPLYAFTDEGVWALEVSATGSFSAKQPITRDVCINPDGITQIDSAVLFPSDRGIMLISGSQTLCISDAINTATPFDVRSLPGMENLHTMLGDGHDVDNCIRTVPFLDFLKDCRMIYDYVHQRIVVYNPGFTYAYVFSLKSKSWSMMYSDIKGHLFSYPEAFAVMDGGNVVDFSQESSDPVPGLLVSRPMKLDAPDLHKTISTVIQRGNFAKGHIRSVLYGSRDLINWHLVWSSKDHFLRGFRGTPYKYFRVALLCNLSPEESIYGASVQFTSRLANQPR